MSSRFAAVVAAEATITDGAGDAIAGIAEYKKAPFAPLANGVFFILGKFVMTHPTAAREDL